VRNRPTESDPGLIPDALACAALVHGDLADPFACLGPHDDALGSVIRVFLPGAKSVDVLAQDSGETLASLDCVLADGLFAARLPARVPYRLRIHWPDAVQETEDPYAFGLLLGDLDLHLFAEGLHREMGYVFGAQHMVVDGVAGVRFAVWAPSAKRVSVVGNFNNWDGRRHPMRLRIEAGVWELFVPRLAIGEVYKYELLGADGLRVLKADPLALQCEVPPGTASIVADNSAFSWHDADWLKTRNHRQAPDAAISIYELHAGSWQHNDFGAGGPPSWDQLAERLVPYVAGLGFTHVELMPIAEHPFGGSWGYQPLAMFAPTGRYGPPDGFARFVDACHAANIGVLLDWVPAHFPSDAHGPVRFDGTALYEHADPREGFHPDWNTLIYNFGRNEVVGFMIASALYWIEHFHIDGLRVDAVASMLYRDYSRKAGEWIPNIHGGRENLEAVAFLKLLNDTVALRCPGAIVVAEESTSWPGVTRATKDGGLGFSYKWNMGWMNDTLRYFERNPLHRKYHHGEMTFGPVYAFSERFMLPLSHDEVVHLKHSLLRKMPNDDWQQHANLRALYGLMWGYPGKKLLFMGGEFAQIKEWDHDTQLEWDLLQSERHLGVQRLIGDLNRLYRDEPGLHAWDCESRGFHWVVADDADNSVFAWLREGPDGATPLLVICNLTPVPRSDYRIRLPYHPGSWRERINTDSAVYGGSNLGNVGAQIAPTIPHDGGAASLSLCLPPLSTLILRYEP